ncbi:ROK family protein [Singulisphaera sp. PoT]|uniref:ROK family protein n=1 Tax=Singulisphaera sp. PoT TaxID=3411797 RepID=UPI003BF5FCAD
MATTEPLLLGIEFGGTKLQLGLGRGDGQILALERRTVEPARGAQGILAQVEEAYARLLESQGLSTKSGAVAAAGIGFGGPVDAEKGLVIKSHQIEGWDRFPLAAWIRERLGIPLVTVQNDADTAGLAEARYGAGENHSPLLYVTIGSGIGGGLILDGKIFRGAGAGALEIGHLWVIDRNNCDMGVQTLEDVASGWAIGQAARLDAERQVAKNLEHGMILRMAGGQPEKVTGALVAEAARLGDPEAKFIIGKAVHAMAHALNQAITLIAPRRIILGGGVSLMGEELWFEPIRSQLDLNVFPPFRGTYDIVPAKLGEEVVVHGALALAIDTMRNSSA